MARKVFRSILHYHDVLKIALAALPVPDDQTPWEQLIEYRNDQASLDQFLDLRHWMSEIARGQLTQAEFEEKFDYLLSRYRGHLELEKMKSNTTTFETFVVTVQIS